MSKFIGIVFLLLLSNRGVSQEVLFANYFDIETNKNEGAEVFGKVNLKSNKDFLVKPLPKSYKFVLEDNTSVFIIRTEFDSEGRVFGVLKVAPGQKTSMFPKDVSLKVALKNGKHTIAFKDIVVHIVDKTMWQELFDVYSPITINTSRMFGRKKLSDKKLEDLLIDIESNNGKLSFSSIYSKHPSNYKNSKAYDTDLEKTINTIGGLGYAYANSKKYGKKGDDPKSRLRLKKAIYAASIAFMNSVPIYGRDLMVDGNPVGEEIGDGFSRLGEHNFATHGMVTHQWRATDALAAPLVHVWPELLVDISKGDKQAQQLYDAVIRYYQLFFSVEPRRRHMNDERQRWQSISDINYSEGAWADANIGHRMRTLMVMPILWADYNRPITYVPYWYDDYYDGTEYEGLTFAKDWSPNGVIADVRSWCDKLSLPSHRFNQSGFHPDGSVTHHRGHNASDVAMVAYGFEWLTTVNSAFDYFKNTPMPLKNENYQFLADRLNYTYRQMVYKNAIDYTVAGRSFFGNLQDFGSKHMIPTIVQLLEGKSPTTVIENENKLRELKKDLEQGGNKHTATTAFWVADYLVHRKEEGDENYFFSVKHKSVRTSGAEDFDEIRKSWHAASGVFHLKVDGDEYSKNVLANFDWHTLPGVTEGWRSDVLPSGLPASASLPGGNEFSGILSDGKFGVTGYHHKPIDDYTSAEALKSYHLIGRFGTALGSNIKRKSSSITKEEIVTTIDQSEQRDIITYSVNGVENKVRIGESVNLKVALTGPAWIHHVNKGYLVFPKEDQNLLIKSGSEINVTATDLNIDKSSNYILALDHGINPTETSKNGYHYVLVANAAVEEMPKLLKDYQKTKIVNAMAQNHMLSDISTKVDQVVFYHPGKVELRAKNWIEVDNPSIVLIQDLGDIIKLSLVDALHSLDVSEITIKTSIMLKEGIYNYKFSGIEPIEGEKAVVTNIGAYSKITVDLPDSLDAEYYNFREQMFAGAPIVLSLEKK